MKRLKTWGATAAMAALALAMLSGSERAAFAQEAAMETPSVDQPAPRHYRTMRAPNRYGARPLTVSRRAPPPFIEPGPGREFAGPAAIAVAPIRAASEIVDMPFRALASVFPPRGDPARNPLVLIGAPIQFAGQIAQIPFRIVEAPFRVDGPFSF